MTEQNTITTKQLLLSGLICLILGTAVIVLFVLPAEYNQDPTGFGDAVGLDKLAGTSIEEVVVIPVSQPESDGHYVVFNPQTSEVPYDQWGQPQPVLNGNNHKAQDRAFKTETLTVTLELDGLTEYKALMNQGDTILYSWVSDQPIYTDFHAHQDTGNPDFFTRYAETESNEEHGAIVAPYTGQHGWFWLNLGDEPATIELTVTGYFDEIIEIDMNEGY